MIRLQCFEAVLFYWCCCSDTCFHGAAVWSWTDPSLSSEIKHAFVCTCMQTQHLLFPSGSHDSFSFYIDEASPVGPEQPETVQNFVSVFGTVAKKLMRKWLATQTMNFISQLEAGIRFFDLRISTKPRDPDNELFFAHGLFSATVCRELPVF